MKDRLTQLVEVAETLLLALVEEGYEIQEIAYAASAMFAKVLMGASEQVGKPHDKEQSRDLAMRAKAAFDSTRPEGMDLFEWALAHAIHLSVISLLVVREIEDEKACATWN